MTTIKKLKLMTSKQVVRFAGQIVKQCKDRAAISAGLGNEDDFLQSVCKLLIEFKTSARELREESCRLDIVVCSLARGEARRNWMSDQASNIDDIEYVDDEDEELTEAEFAVFLSETVDAPAEHSLDDVDGLSALDKLFIKHDTQSNVRQAAQTKDIAAFFGITTRAVRLRKEKLHANLTERFNLPKNFFEEKVELPMPHLKKIVVEEKDPLANFVPLKLNDFNRFRTVGIR